MDRQFKHKKKKERTVLVENLYEFIFNFSVRKRLSNHKSKVRDLEMAANFTTTKQNKKTHHKQSQKTTDKLEIIYCKRAINTYHR